MLEYAKKQRRSSLRLQEAGEAGKAPLPVGNIIWAGFFFTFLTNFLYGTKITDEATCYKMVSRNALSKIKSLFRRF